MAGALNRMLYAHSDEAHQEFNREYARKQKEADDKARAQIAEWEAAGVLEEQLTLKLENFNRELTELTDELKEIHQHK